MLIRPIEPGDADWIRALLEAAWGGAVVERTGELIDALTLPGFVARESAERLGLITLLPAPGHLEIVTLNSVEPRRGIGTALLNAAEADARLRGLAELRVFTSNDNLDALRFYQRRGFRLARVHPDAITRARRLKPTIPAHGCYGIPIRDELELFKIL